MDEEKNYSSDLALIRSMMERSSKFLSLSGWAGILAGTYAIAGAFIAWKLFGLSAEDLAINKSLAKSLPFNTAQIVLVFGTVLILALGTAMIDSYRKARARNENAWNPVSRKLMRDMAVPLLSGGIAIIILVAKGMIHLVAPFSLLFYGLALFVAGKYTYNEVRVLGYVEIALGLVALWFSEYAFVLWIVGFGIAHIIYGIIMHYSHRK